MQLKKTFKGLIIALPVLALAACSSTQSTGAGDSNNQSSGSSVSQTANQGAGDTVKVGTVEKVKTPEQIREERYAVLRRDHIIYFDFDKSSIRNEFSELLDAHADFLVKNPGQKILIEGHCDERGTPEYNIALGERRAKTVAKYLKNLGVQDNQISLVSYGEEKPQDRSRTKAAQAKNRRAVVVYKR